MQMQRALITDGGLSRPTLTVSKNGKHKTRIGLEMRLTTQIGEYEMDQVSLDLESDVNFLPKQSWEWMGRLALQWSPIQLRVANQ